MRRQSFNRRRGGFRWKIMLVFAVGAAGYYFANQKSVPFTGRTQLRTMKLAQEMQLGLQSYQQILRDSKVQASGPIVDKVREIGANIAQAAANEDPGFQWAFNVIDSKQVNAFAYRAVIRPFILGSFPSQPMMTVWQLLWDTKSVTLWLTTARNVWHNKICSVLSEPVSL